MTRREHIAHMYRDEAQMAKAVGEWIAPALRRGSGALLACTREHARLVRDELTNLGIDVATAAAHGRFVVLEARALMGRFLIDGHPDPARFRRIMQGPLDDMHAATGGGPMRAWGEMVDLLVKDGRMDAARELEALWNDLLERTDIQLLCSYELAGSDPALHRLLTDAHELHTDVVLQPIVAR